MPNTPPPWTAERRVDPDLARTLIADQFPEIAPSRLRHLGEGWDNVAYLVDERWVFRFPRREIAVGFLSVELRWLPQLGAIVPLPIPVPIFQGTPSERFPWPFGGYEFLPGRSACSCSFDAIAMAEGLAHFLKALHRPAPADLPDDPYFRHDPERALKRLGPHLERIADRFDVDLIRGTLADLGTAKASTRRDWVHGDFYARHVLVGDRGAPCGVIDWGDVHAGDPALDLSVAWSLLDESARSVFFAQYGPVDADAAARARYRALHYGVILSDYGREASDDALQQAGQRALRYAL